MPSSPDTGFTTYAPIVISTLSLLISAFFGVKEILRHRSEKRARRLCVKVPFARMILYSIEEMVFCDMDMILENPSSLPVSVVGISLHGKDGSTYDADVFSRRFLTMTSSATNRSASFKSSDLPISLPSHQATSTNVIFDLPCEAPDNLCLPRAESLTDESALLRQLGNPQRYSRSWRSFPARDLDVTLQTSRGPLRMKVVVYHRPLIDALAELKNASRLPQSASL